MCVCIKCVPHVVFWGSTCSMSNTRIHVSYVSHVLVSCDLGCLMTDNLLTLYHDMIVPKHVLIYFCIILCKHESFTRKWSTYNFWSFALGSLVL